MSKIGRFITLEGVEGAGKSTVMETLRCLLQRQGIEFLSTREPGGTELGEALRELLLGHAQGMSDDTELLLMFAARAEHLKARILPALQQGCWVLCDRFTDATYAYQGGGRGIPQARIADLENWVQKGLKPDLTLLLDLPVEQGRARAQGRSAPDRIEQEQDAFFQRVRRVYLQRARQESQRFRIIDASQSPQQVAAQVTKVLHDYIRATEA